MCFGHCATIRILPIKLSSSKRMLFKFKMLHLFLAALKKLEYDSYKVWYSENDFFFPSAELFLLPPTCTISECQLKPSAKMLIKKWYIVVTIVVVFTSPLPSLEKLLQNAKSAVAERFGQNIENSEEHVVTCCHFWPYESTFLKHELAY